jgi:hypothetical protein
MDIDSVPRAASHFGRGRTTASGVDDDLRGRFLARRDTHPADPGHACESRGPGEQTGDRHAGAEIETAGAGCQRVLHDRLRTFTVTNCSSPARRARSRTLRGIGDRKSKAVAVEDRDGEALLDSIRAVVRPTIPAPTTMTLDTLLLDSCS